MKTLPPSLPPAARQEVLDFLLTRRSRPLKLLQGPAPDAETLTLLLSAAARCPDHGKLEPWRFIVLEKGALNRLAGAARARAQALELDAELTAKAASQFETSPFCVAVVAIARDAPKIPAVEQVLSAGAVCLGLLNAALAAGFGANWLSGRMSHDRIFVEGELGLSAQESIAGFIHIGRCETAPPERPRPDITALTQWVRE